MQTDQLFAFARLIREMRGVFSPSPAESRGLAHSKCHLNRAGRTLLAIIVSATGLAGFASGEDRKEQPAPVAASVSAEPAAVTAARQRAELLHDVYASALEVMHHHYFRTDVATVPARALEDIFDDMTALSGDKAHWISVNTKAMSIDHRPGTPFEKKAASVLSAGKGAYEAVENGVYHRAAVIPLGINCVGCHVGRFSTPPKSPRAGLVISITLQAQK